MLVPLFFSLFGGLVLWFGGLAEWGCLIVGVGGDCVVVLFGLYDASCLFIWWVSGICSGFVGDCCAFVRVFWFELIGVCVVLFFYFFPLLSFFPLFFVISVL